MINLFERYNQAAWDLHYSLVKSGYQNPTIVLEDDGFLPDDVTSPYLFFSGFDQVKGNGRYFNQVPVPEFWEIKANNSKGDIYEFNHKRGQIHFSSPNHLRLVKEVDWYDDDHRLRSKDHYNKKGYRFAETIYDVTGNAITTTYFDVNDREVVVKNHVTGDYTLNYKDKIYIFRTTVEFVLFYINEAGFELDRIFYNSLSTPFFVAYYCNQPGSDVLFWQEDINDSIPGNMKLLLTGEKGRLTTVAVQNYKTYEKMVPLIEPRNRPLVTFLGYQYRFRRPNRLKSDALILTNSDNIEKLTELVQALPQLHFHIGALTEMSSRLREFGRFKNVTLYPAMTTEQSKILFDRCDYFLDINHGSEILNATRTAFENQMVIMAFENTVHHRDYIAEFNIFKQEDTQEMINHLAIALRNPTVVEQMVEEQKTTAHAENEDRYHMIIGV